MWATKLSLVSKNAKVNYDYKTLCKSKNVIYKNRSLLIIKLLFNKVLT